MPNIRSMLVTSGAIGAAALGGGAMAAAATSSTTSSGSTTAAVTQASGAVMPAPGTAAHEDAEKAVTGTAAAKAQAAAVKSLGGGTAGAVTTDFTGNGYEVTVTKSDGSKVTVHLDSSFSPLRGRAGAGAPPTGPPGA